MLNIVNAEIKVAEQPNELNVVTLHYTLVRRNGLAGMVGKFEIPISDIWLARELFDAYSFHLRPPKEKKLS
jgi:hypothetical protein